MDHYFSLLLLAFSVSVAALWLYWGGIYPALMIKARFKIAAIQDEVRLQAVKDKKLAMTRAYVEFEHFLLIANRFVRYHEYIGLYSRNPQQHEVEEVSHRMRSILAEPSLADQFQELTRWILVIRVVAAPTYLCIAAFLAFFSLFSDWARNLSKQKEQEAFTIGECLPA